MINTANKLSLSVSDAINASKDPNRKVVISKEKRAEMKKSQPSDRQLAGIKKYNLPAEQIAKMSAWDVHVFFEQKKVEREKRLNSPITEAQRDFVVAWGGASSPDQVANWTGRDFEEYRKTLPVRERQLAVVADDDDEEPIF